MDELDAVLVALGLPPATTWSRAQGFDATVWRAEVAGRTLAVRLLRPGRSAAAELDALDLAARRGVPVPGVVAAGRYAACDAYAATWCAGRTVGDRLLAGDDPRPLGELFGHAQARLHRPAADGSVLCHLDFQPFNVLVEHESVTGIVDWTNARIADPRADLAKTRVLLDLAPALFPAITDAIAPFAAGWRAGYARERPLPDDHDLAPWLRDAARREVPEWTQRVADGEVPPEVAAAARRIAETDW